MAKKRKKRRKRHYKTGVHKSQKCKNSPMEYRSGWELTVAKHLDNDPLVLYYEYEPIKIPYISNKKRGIIKNYIPDFLITYADGRKILVEVKRTKALSQLIVRKKSEAAKLWASKNNCRYVFWTDNIIKALEKIERSKKKKK